MTDREFEVEIYCYFMLYIATTYRLLGNNQVAFVTHMKMMLPYVGVDWNAFYNRVIAFKNYRPTRKQSAVYMSVHLGLSRRRICRALKLSPNNFQDIRKDKRNYRWQYVPAGEDYSRAIEAWQKLKREVDLFV